jgi:hypothetical protein
MLAPCGEGEGCSAWDLFGVGPSVDEPGLAEWLASRAFPESSFKSSHRWASWACRLLA